MAKCLIVGWMSGIYPIFILLIKKLLLEKSHRIANIDDLDNFNCSKRISLKSLKRK